MRSRFRYTPALLAILLCAGAMGQTLTKGTRITVRTIDRIESKEGEVGQSYRASLQEGLVVDGKEVAAKGADCVLRIVEMQGAGRVKGKASLKLAVAQIRMGNELVAVDTDPAVLESKGKGRSTGMRAGLGAAIGAGVGAAVGGGTGAAVGAGIGGAAGAASSILTSGPSIKVAPETVLAFVVR